VVSEGSGSLADGLKM